MFDDNEGPKDWELKDEEPSERLQKKWDEEEAKGSRTVVCPSCKKETSAENLTCVFCNTAITAGSCPFRRLFAWVKRLLVKG